MKTVSFYGTCSAGGQQTLVSKRINHPYTVREIHSTFAPGCENTMTLRYYKSNDDSAPDEGQPNDISMLRDYGQVDYIVGNASQKKMKHELHVTEKGTYLKVTGDNSDAFDHTIDTQIYIETDPED